MPAAQGTGAKVAKGAFRIAGRIALEAGKEAFRQAQERREVQQHGPVAQGRQIDPPASTPVVQGVPVAQSVYVEPRAQSQSQRTSPAPSGYQNQSHGRTPALYNEGPDVVWTTVGTEYGVHKCCMAALQEQWQAAAGDVKKFWQQMNEAADTQLFCCCMVLLVILGGVFAALMSFLVVGVGNMLVYLVLIPHTISVYMYYMCQSPRISCTVKALLIPAFPIFAIFCAISVLLVSFWEGWKIGFTPSPHPLFLPFEAVGKYAVQGRQWRVQAYKELISPDGPRYDLSALSCLLIPPYMLLGLVWGLLAFLVIAVLEAPRMWWHVSFNYYNAKCCPCIDDCITCSMPFLAVFYVLGMVISAPFIGLITGATVGYGCGKHNTNFFKAEFDMANGYLQELDREMHGGN